MISVIVPVYNDFESLKECVRALCMQQTQSIFEIIISDDGSKDNTVSMAQKYCAQFQNVKIISNPHKGPAAARNAGARAAQGDIILFTDADCVPAADWIEKNRQFFEKNPDFSAVKGIYKTCQKSIVARLCQIEFEERYAVLAKNHETDFVDTYSAGVLKKAFFAVNGFDESYTTANNEDVDFSFRLFNKGYKIGFSRDIQVYHTHPATWKKYAYIKYWRAFYRMKVYRKHVEKIKKDSYTPLNMKLQIILLPFLVLMMCIPGMRKKAAVAFAALCTPLCIHASEDYTVIPFVPLFICIRTGAFISGIVHGIKENWL